MDDRQIALTVITLFVLVVPLSMGLALWLVMRLRRKSDQPLSQDTANVVTVPVRGLKRHYGLFGHSENSINPRLEIASDGLRFKVFKPVHWPFGEIVEVDTVWAPFSAKLSIRARQQGRLFVNLADDVRARDLLRALPPSVPLTERAAALRDSGA